jgi:hypothetical protein
MIRGSKAAQALFASESQRQFYRLVRLKLPLFGPIYEEIVKKLLSTFSILKVDGNAVLEP